MIEAAAPLLMIVGGFSLQASCATTIIRRRVRSDEIGPLLQAVYDEAAAEPVPAEMNALLDGLLEKSRGVQAGAGGGACGTPPGLNQHGAGEFR